jgi:FkbM family methyltransferase
MGMKRFLAFLRGERPHKTPTGRLVAMLADRSIDLFLDIGGNSGQTGKALREYGYHGKIISFEPLPEPYALLQQAASGDLQWVVAPRMAVGRKACMITLNQSLVSEMSSVLPPAADLVRAMPSAATDRKIEAPMSTLADIIHSMCQETHRVFVKIDTQGYEHEVLLGLDPLWDRVAGFHLEMSLFPLYEGEVLFDQLITLLKGHGLEPYMLYDTAFSRTLKRQLQLDGVFFRP